MRIQSNRLAGKVLKANKTIVVLSTNVQIEHEEGFDKALRQAVYLLEAHTLAAGFNISQDVYDGKMMLGLGLPSKDDGATNDGWKTIGQPTRKVSWMRKMLLMITS